MDYHSIKFHQHFLKPFTVKKSNKHIQINSFIILVMCVFPRYQLTFRTNLSRQLASKSFNFQPIKLIQYIFFINSPIFKLAKLIWTLICCLTVDTRNASRGKYWLKLLTSIFKVIGLTLIYIALSLFVDSMHDWNYNTMRIASEWMCDIGEVERQWVAIYPSKWSLGLTNYYFN